MTHTPTATVQRTNLFPVLDSNSFDWEEGDDIFGIIRSLVNGEHPGIFSTVDEEGRPRSRWMASLSFEEMPWVYTLTDMDSRKVAQIEQNSQVSWMFCNADLTLVLNLDGKARVMSDPATVKQQWSKIRHKEQAYFLKKANGSPGIAVIGTKIERVECTTPQSSMRFSVGMDELNRIK